MANWEGLPRELLELITDQRLAIEDSLAFGAVCTSWRSTAAKGTYDTKSKALWLMDYAHDSTTEFCSLSREDSPSELARISSLDLVSTRMDARVEPGPIELPALEKLHGLVGHSFGCQRIDRIALSSSPSSSRSYTVMVSIHRDLGPPGLAFHRSGEDAWTVVSRVTHAPWPYVLQLIYHDGSFVALDAHLGVMTLNESERRMELRLVLGAHPGDRPYLVNRSGSLLVALRTWGEGNRFRVFEVDLEKGTQEEVESLGNASLFLNDGSSFCMEFNAGSCLPGIMPNHVYFTD
ncbi:hypothetical protein NL676_031286 [Syzygium grande]|nr:hypothetical protein NL676_031286 [Syzygium grande]